jgi:hypothetical protein
MQVELFKNQTPVVIAIDKIWKSEYDTMKISFNKFFVDLLETKYFADIVFDSKLFEFSESLDREFFTNISLLLSSYKGIGSYEAIISIVRAILGQDASVEFSNDGKDIAIISVAKIESNIITHDFNNIIDTAENQIVSIDNSLQAQRNTLIDLLYKFLPAGIKYNISFVAPTLQVVNTKRRKNKNKTTIGVI